MRSLRGKTGDDKLIEPLVFVFHTILPSFPFKAYTVESVLPAYTTSSFPTVTDPAM